MFRLCKGVAGLLLLTALVFAQEGCVAQRHPVALITPTYSHLRDGDTAGVVLDVPGRAEAADVAPLTTTTTVMSTGARRPVRLVAREEVGR